jgi:DNA-binding transcriptional ArsR family regulator
MIIFGLLNMIKTVDQIDYLDEAKIFRVLTHPARLEILDILRKGEQCVCHLEAYLGYRQAFISQHLTILRESGLVEVRRDGWNVYYKISDERIFSLLDISRSIIGHQNNDEKSSKLVDCPCPKCREKIIEKI